MFARTNVVMVVVRHGSFTVITKEISFVKVVVVAEWSALSASLTV